MLAYPFFDLSETEVRGLFTKILEYSVNPLAGIHWQSYITYVVYRIKVHVVSSLTVSVATIFSMPTLRDVQAELALEEGR